MPPTLLWTPPSGTKILRNSTCALTVRQGACESAPKGENASLWAPKGAKRWQNGAEKEAKWRQNKASNGDFLKKWKMWFGPVIYYI